MGAKFNAQFERSGGESPMALAEVPRTTIDPAATFEAYSSGVRSATEMSGGELFALIGHIKKEHGAKGDALEAELMKISRQKDKKIRLMDWVAENIRAAPSPAAPPPGTPGGMPKLQLAAAMGTPQGKAFGERPLTARPDYAGGNPITAAFSPPPPATAGSQTARAHVPAAPPDMSATVAEFVRGKEHMKMSGAEYYNLVAWLKTRGHNELEDKLMRVKLLGDKKFQLVKHMKETCAEMSAPAAGEATPPGVQAGVVTTPQGAQVLTVAHPTNYDPHAPPTAHQPLAPPPQSFQPAQPAALPHAVAAPVSAPSAMAPPQTSIVGCVAVLEQTVMRLEESFAFAVECMQTDLAAAKEQLRQLKAQVGH